MFTAPFIIAQAEMFTSYMCGIRPIIVIGKITYDKLKVDWNLLSSENSEISRFARKFKRAVRSLT